MKKFFAAGLLALALAGPSQAHPFGIQVNLGVRLSSHNVYFGLGPGTLQASPWYNYWPYEAHFQVPAPTGYPWWGAPQTPAPVYFPPAAAPGYMPPATAPGYMPPTPTPVPDSAASLGLQPASFYYPPAGVPAPSYWYGR